MKIPIEKACAGDRFFFDQDDLAGTFVMNRIELLAPDYDEPYDVANQRPECYFTREQDGVDFMFPAWMARCMIWILNDEIYV